jgi:thiol-disulfide isomerase/thioredoxin
MMKQTISSPLFLLAVLAFVLATGTVAAQVPADTVLRDFVPIGDLELVLDEVVEGNAEIFRSDKAVAFLVLSPDLLSPVLLSPRRRAVETVDLMKVSRRADGAIDLLADAVLASRGQFRLDGTDVLFQVEGREARLREKLPLLGKRTAEDLTDYNPEYGRTAAAYQPGTEIIEALGGQKTPVEVRIYFGTWCPHCGRAVPKIIKTEDELGKGMIQFAYYGLPKDLGNAPEAKALGIKGVPTGIVYQGGKEIGRITANDWKMPELALRDILGGGGAG